VYLFLYRYRHSKCSNTVGWTLIVAKHASQILFGRVSTTRISRGTDVNLTQVYVGIFLVTYIPETQPISTPMGARETFESIGLRFYALVVCEKLFKTLFFFLYITLSYFHRPIIFLKNKWKKKKWNNILFINSSGDENKL